MIKFTGNRKYTIRVRCGAEIETPRLNRPDWNVVEGDVRDFSAKDMLDTMIAGRRIRDITDLPLDLAT